MVIRSNASRRNWNALSSGYRNRLERAGISRRDYERGVSVSAARGHAATPERPSRASPERHPEYFSRRQALINSIVADKRSIYGSKENFNAKRSREAIANHPKTGKPRGIKELEKIAKKAAAMANSSYEEDDYYGEGDDYDDDWLYYH